MDRNSIIARYRHLRGILQGQKQAAYAYLSEQTILDQARFLRMAAGKTVLADTRDEYMLVVDLALHAPRFGRSRAFERYRNAARPAPDSEEAGVLDALCAARFVIGMIEGCHDVAGLVVTDLLRNAELQLMDLNLEASWSESFAFAAYLVTLDGFSMSSSILVPIEKADLEDALFRLPPGRDGTVETLAADPLFAGLIWRAALARGAMDQIVTMEVGGASQAFAAPAG